MTASIRQSHVIHVALLLCLLIQTVDMNYDFSCPSQSQWIPRAVKNCTNSGYYHCLLDKIREGKKEFCLSPVEYTSGRMAVYSGNLDAQMCSSTRYMPFLFVSNMFDECLYQKSICNEEGQITHENRSPTYDTSCLCDFTKGYAFVTPPKNKCYCVPSEEDCSCYKKICVDNNQILSSDYSCMEITQPLYGTQCYVAVPHTRRHEVSVAKDSNTSTSSCKPCFKKESQIKREINFMATIIFPVIAMLIVSVIAMYCREFNIINVKDVFQLNVKHMKVKCTLKGKNLRKGYILNDDAKPREPRILDMCFVTIKDKIFLIFVDADNNCIVKRSITDHVLPYVEPFSKERKVNRLAKINDELIAVIYKSKFDIMIYSVTRDIHPYSTAKVNQEEFRFPDYGIQGIALIDYISCNSNKQKFTFILSNRSFLYTCQLQTKANETTTTVTVDHLDCGKTFETARRFAVCKDQHLLFIADEDDKKITTIKFNGTFHHSLKGHNRGLQNLRAIAVTQRKLYAATSAGISVYSFTDDDHRKFADKKYKMLIEYKQHVEHTRGLCLEKRGTRIFIGVSCVMRGKDFITVFSFEETEEFC